MMLENIHYHVSYSRIRFFRTNKCVKAQYNKVFENVSVLLLQLKSAVFIYVISGYKNTRKKYTARIRGTLGTLTKTIRSKVYIGCRL